MALTFPLAEADFFGGLPVTSCTFDLPESLSISGVTGAGEVLTEDIGNRLWSGTVQLAQRNFDDAEAAKALISTLRRAGRSFFVYNFAKPGPRKDPYGTILGAATPEIATIVSNNREMTISGLPIGYVLSIGDFLSFPYGDDPVRYGLYQLARGGIANAGGVAAVEVSDFIRPGAEAGIAVQLIKPVCKAVIVPGTFNPGTASGVSISGISFGWRQTLR